MQGYVIWQTCYPWLHCDWVLWQISSIRNIPKRRTAVMNTTPHIAGNIARRPLRTHSVFWRGWHSSKRQTGFFNYRRYDSKYRFGRYPTPNSLQLNHTKKREKKKRTLTHSDRRHSKEQGLTANIIFNKIHTALPAEQFRPSRCVVVLGVGAAAPAVASACIRD